MHCFDDLNRVIFDVCRSGVAYPVHYGCAVDVASGEVFPAGFDDQARTDLIFSGKLLGILFHFREPTKFVI